MIRVSPLRHRVSAHICVTRIICFALQVVTPQLLLAVFISWHTRSIQGEWNIYSQFVPVGNFLCVVLFLVD